MDKCQKSLCKNEFIELDETLLFNKAEREKYFNLLSSLSMINTIKDVKFTYNQYKKIITKNKSFYDCYKCVNNKCKSILLKTSQEVYEKIDKYKNKYPNLPSYFPYVYNDFHKLLHKPDLSINDVIKISFYLILFTQIALFMITDYK